MRNVSTSTHKKLRFYWNDVYRNLDSRIASEPILKRGLEVARAGETPVAGSADGLAFQRYLNFVRRALIKARMDADKRFPVATP
jgi:hypothetical protein